jgi:hypothetical protein
MTPPARGTWGAVKLGVAKLVFRKVTGGPESCTHEKMSGFAGVFVSWLLVPLRVTNTASFTV